MSDSDGSSTSCTPFTWRRERAGREPLESQQRAVRGPRSRTRSAGPAAPARAGGLIVGCNVLVVRVSLTCVSTCGESGLRYLGRCQGLRCRERRSSCVVAVTHTSSSRGKRSVTGFGDSRTRQRPACTASSAAAVLPTEVRSARARACACGEQPDRQAGERPQGAAAVTVTCR